jgi:hypothetical protein
MASTVREQPEWENQQQRQKEARGRNAVHSKRREKGLYKSRSFPVASRQASWGVISDLWGDLASRVQEQRLMEKKVGGCRLGWTVLPRRLV